MAENKFFDKINLEHYHRYVSGMIKKLSDNIDERIDEKFKNFIEDNVSDGEILDARGGERTLGDRLDRFDSQFEHIENNVRKFLKPEDMPSYKESNSYQAIIDIINSGNNVLFNLDRYNIEGVIKVSSNTIITSNNNSLINYKEKTNTYFFVEGSSVLIEKIRINANKCDNGVYINNSSNCEVKQLNIINLTHFAIAVVNSDSIYVSNNVIDSMEAHEGCIACVLSNNIHIDNNNVRRGGHYGIIFEDQVYNSTITNNVVEDINGCGIGVVNIQPKDDLKRTNIVVSNNTIKSVSYDGILVMDALNVSVNNNNIQQMGKETPAPGISNGIRFGMKCGNFEIVNNTVKNFICNGICCSSTDNATGTIYNNFVIDCSHRPEYAGCAIKCYDLNELNYCNNKAIGQYDVISFSNINNLVTTKSKYSITFDFTNSMSQSQIIPKNSKITRISFKIKNNSGGSFTQFIFNNSGSQIFNIYRTYQDGVAEYEYFIKEKNDFPPGLKTSYNEGDVIVVSSGNSVNANGTPHSVVTIEFEY